METAISDSKWQKNVNVDLWPSFDILPGSDWNYALKVNVAKPEHCPLI